MTRPVVHHVGRAGDVAGGMTQVVNAYLAWPFERVDVAVIASRGAPGDHVTAARLALAAAVRLGALAFVRRPAVVVVHLSERGSFVREGLLARWAARCGLPVVAHLHGSEFAAYERAHPSSVARVLGVASTVIVLSEESERIAARHVGPDRVALVPNAVPGAAPVAETPTVVFGGVVSHRKGIDVLQAAWRSVTGDFPGWRLVVAGPIRDADLVADDLPDADFVGAVGHDRLLELLDTAAIAVLPSRDEAMPMFLLEAMAHRAAIVSTTVGGIPTLLDDESAWLIPPGDAPALTAALQAAMADEGLRRRRVDAALERFSRGFSADAIFPRVESIWLRAVEDSPARRRGGRRRVLRARPAVEPTAAEG